ncbi:TIGR03792 family protein [Mastigocoleus testarum]|uniref:Cyanobacterial protein, TIGR03792 family n=1 Tax=Mastigocoleus testarum BC008 TaxID=371196 RepID=A0A0V7ZBN6_9CYAN|nr:TIGR03792 family protein [Mastigocoleus testarum]KST61930.1 cyanobacterial protein, TIGR03792 family [Mastigocoleus testarum BC008]MDJ0773952.1 TIGR03792 family protein [Mastigocoleus sp. MO_167.B18]
MVIELLKFKMDPAVREKFIQKDEDIWTNALRKYSGFLGKEVWINPNDKGEVTIIVQWETREQWKSIPQKDLDLIEAKFDSSLDFNYEMTESSEYQVRKFPRR